MTVVIKKYNDNHFGWLRYDANNVLVEHHRYSALSQCRAVDHESIIFLIPGVDVRMLTVSLPKMSYAELVHAVPYALEEQLASDIDSLHFVIAKHESEGKRSVAVIQKDVWQKQLEELQQSGIQPTAILPDYFALPWLKEQWTIAFEEEIAAVRLDKDYGFSTDAANVPALLKFHLQSLKENTPTQLNILDINKVQKFADIEALGIETKVRTVKPARIIDIASLKDCSFNLLSKVQQADRLKSGRIHWWKHAVTVMVVAVLLTLAAYTAEIFYLKHQERVVTAEITSAYQAIFPGQSLPENPRARVAEMLNQYSVQAKHHVFLFILSKLGQVYKENPMVRVVELNYDKAQLKAKISAPSMDALQHCVHQLIESGLSVRQRQVDTSKDNVSAELSIEVKS